MTFQNWLPTFSGMGRAAYQLLVFIRYKFTNFHGNIPAYL